MTIRVSDRAASERFYALVLGVLDHPKTHDGDWDEWDDLSIVQGGEPTRGLHIGFRAASRELVDAFWQAGVDAGYVDDGAPGVRPQYTEDYYGAFLRDPDGNSAEAMHREGMRTDGVIDHLWIRVADLERSRRFYETIAPYAGFAPRPSPPGRFHFGTGNGSFAVLDDGAPTERLHVAFPTATDEAVAAFHRAALEAGYADNGPPGERPQYHAGYHGAFVLDPDGNNVEVVNHNRP